MPDLQTELTKVFDEWSKDDKPSPHPKEKATMPKKLFAITNNVSRDTFNFIRDNPGLRSFEVRDALAKAGHKEGSITSLVSQLRRSGQVERKGDGTHYAKSQEYTPLHKLTAVHPVTRTHKRAYKRKPAAAAGIAALQPVTTPAIPATPAAPVVVEHLLNSLSIMQARALYDELKKVFGESK
jgi:hypothetical protein